MFARTIRLVLTALLAAFLVPGAAQADPADINAAARGVVRIVIIAEEGGQLYPVAHGTGFAVAPERIVTNAHVVAEAQGDRNLSVGIVPSDGGKAVYGRIVGYSPRNDLALISTTAAMNLPVLTISSNPSGDAGGVTAVGYPMNVDRAQGLSAKDIFNAQPPVKSQGFLSGRRPSRDFDTLLHTAPIGRGSSGGPLLDDCGRVVGVNSFGTESDSADSEFYFAVSTRELLPFLVANGITAQINGLPCRSIAELDAQEQARAEREQLAAMQEQDAKQAREAQHAEAARREAEFAIISARENGMMHALLLVICGAAAGFAAYELRESGTSRKARVAAAAAGVALIGAIAAWILRPGFDQVEDRVAQALAEESRAAEGRTGVIATPAAAKGKSDLVCVVNMERSRITTGKTNDIPFTWAEDGCVNGRTQYGLIDGKWSRIFVPNSEAAVSINSYDPEKHEYRVERYLLGHEAMAAVRKARGEYQTPQCGAGDAAVRDLGTNQATVSTLLPTQPNERLVYDCSEGRQPS